jgi:hypothetical protein
MIWVFPEPTSIERNIKYTAHSTKRFAVCLLRDEGITSHPRPLRCREKRKPSFRTSIDVAFLKSWISLGYLLEIWKDPGFWCSQDAQRCTPGSSGTGRQGPSSHIKPPRDKNAPGGANAQKHDLTIASSVRCVIESALKLSCLCVHNEQKVGSLCHGCQAIDYT